ncbi:MAG: 16S rRNA processing protein RimM [Clostridia bacterium]|nr:16S rRNA processing protein RimM [Clostridia bacterium]
MDLIETGKIVNTHGIRGEVKVMPWCDSPEDFYEFENLYLKSGTCLEIEALRVHKDTVIIKFKNINSINEAEKYRNYVLYADKEDFMLEEDCFFIADLMGIEVYDEKSNEFYGTITEVLQNGAKDVFVIKNKETGKEYLLPYIDETVIEIDIKDKKMKIRPLEGLFE